MNHNTKLENQHRARRARLVIQAYADFMNYDVETEGVETITVDMLADLMHYCELHPENKGFYEMASTALGHFIAEWGEEKYGP